MSFKSIARNIVTRSPIGVRFYQFLGRIKWKIKNHALITHKIKFAKEGSRKKQILFDLSWLSAPQSKVAGQVRVMRSLFLEWLNVPPEGYEMRAVFGKGARIVYADMEGIAERIIDNKGLIALDEIEPMAGDIFFSVMFHGPWALNMKRYFTMLRHNGVLVYFVLHDVNPCLFPGDFAFFGGSEFGEELEWRNLKNRVEAADGAVCVSKFSADSFISLAAKNRYVPLHFKIDFAHLGADFDKKNDSKPDHGDSQDFLMVGSMTSYKSHLQVIDAFERIWADGLNVRLVIIGKSLGLIGEDKIIERITSHPEHGRRLIWLNNATDDELVRYYSNSAALIFASYAEGFGLPLIEAAQYELPIIARDIPVFREVAGDYAYYFEDSRDPQVIADAVEKWMTLRDEGHAPQSKGMPYLSWKESAARFADAIVNDNWYKVWE